MKTELPEMSRDMFLKIIWERFCNESMSHHSNTLRYARLLIECNGWEKQQAGQNQPLTYIGSCDCKEEGYPVQKQQVVQIVKIGNVPKPSTHDSEGPDSGSLSLSRKASMAARMISSGVH